jgi:hypothetical protein
MSSNRVILVIGLIALPIFLYQRFDLGKSGDVPSLTQEVATTTQPLPTDALLYFTAIGCASLPYVSATDADGADRVPLEPFSATDGYDYAAIEGTREMRTMLSRFSGSCEDTPPSATDSFQALEVGITQSDEIDGRAE